MFVPAIQFSSPATPGYPPWTPNPCLPSSKPNTSPCALEILKRIELRQQLISILLTLAGAFLFTQLMAIGIELVKRTFNPLENALLVIDALAVIAVLWILVQAKR